MVVPDPIERYRGSFERTPAYEEIPWTPFTRPLEECRFALVTTGGVHRKDQPGFVTDPDGYDWSYREFSSDTSTDQLTVTHKHYNHEHVDRDINAMLPLDRFRELAREGVVGGLGPRCFGLYGYIMEPLKLAEETAPAVAAALRSDGVDAAFMTPA